MSRKVMVGMFLLGALFIFGLATFYIENWQVYLREGYTLKARFPAANMLDRGDVVRLAGVEVGTVTGVSVDTDAATDKPVAATLLIDPDNTIRADDTAEIRMSSLFGGNHVAIMRGDRDAAALQEGDTISNTSVAPGLATLVSSSGKTLSRMEDTMDRVNEIVTRVREGKGTVGKLLAEEKAYNELV
ncbi:MAG: MlaD family protein, partial [Planctomycetota bacterium]